MWGGGGGGADDPNTCDTNAHTQRDIVAWRCHWKNTQRAFKQKSKQKDLLKYFIIHDFETNMFKIHCTRVKK